MARGTKDQTWGRVRARPNEYLVVLRRGRVVRQGPGASAFVWPSDSWAAIPTSIQRVSFSADQITAEKVGVEVRGVAVFRVAEPLLAFRVLEFDDARGAQSVGEILRDMFIGAARRLVANMTVEDCLTKRKEHIATELLREVSPVVSGDGRATDTTDRGWGIVLDTIEIQDVKILSETVFANLQAPYRAELETKARQSMVGRDEAVHHTEVEAKKAMHTAQRELERQQADAEEASRLRSVAVEERVAAAEAEAQRRLARMRHESELERAAQAEALEAAEIERDAGFALRRAQSAAASLEVRLDVERREGELSAALEGLRQDVANRVSDERIRHEYVTKVLPALTSAMVQKTGDVQVMHMATEGAGGWVDALMGQLVNLTRSAANESRG